MAYDLFLLGQFVSIHAVASHSIIRKFRVLDET
jgi:hypothetical protein